MNTGAEFVHTASLRLMSDAISYDSASMLFMSVFGNGPRILPYPYR